MNQLPMRSSVCLFIHDRRGWLFIGERVGEPGHWQLPQGGIESGEAFEDSAVREASEETGAPPTAFVFRGLLASEYQYEFLRPPANELRGFRGQHLRFAVLAFTGQDGEITLGGDKAEFRSWRWCNPDELLDVVAPLRRLGYEASLSEFLTRFGREFMSHAGSS